MHLISQEEASPPPSNASVKIAFPSPVSLVSLTIRFDCCTVHSYHFSPNNPTFQHLLNYQREDFLVPVSAKPNLNYVNKCDQESYA